MMLSREERLARVREDGFLLGEMPESMCDEEMCLAADATFGAQGIH